MAKPKVSFIVEPVTDKVIRVVHSNAANLIIELRTIEGIDTIMTLASSSATLDVWIDPRYDINELANEIRELLAAEIPTVFKE